MAFRVVAFLAAVMSPLPWNVLLIAAAAFLPAIAVLLGNARDNSPAPVVGDDVVPDRPALGAGTVVPGEVDPEGGAR